jgi:hypothetical protein
MGALFPTGMKISPSFTEPELILTYAQASGAFNALSGGKPRIKIGSEDMAVYVNHLDLRTDVVAGQSPSNLLPSADLEINYYSTPTYLLRVGAIWDHHDMARASIWGVSLPTAQDLAMGQGIFQQMRNALLYGFNPGNGEGLLNTNGATKTTLPPDSYGNTTASTYDNGQMATYLLGQIVTLKTRMYQSGGNIKNTIKVISPQRIFLQFVYSNIVQVTSYQRPGAGTATTGEVVKVVARESGDTFDWYFDDTLQAQGTTSSYDAVLLTMPEIEQPTIPGIDTNMFAGLQPNIKATNLMYADMPAPMKIPTPVQYGAVSEVHEMRITSGWCVRPQAITIISMPP